MQIMNYEPERQYLIMNWSPPQREEMTPDFIGGFQKPLESFRKGFVGTVSTVQSL